MSKIYFGVNPVYFDLFENKDRYLAIMGGRGSGKSHFAAQKIVKRCREYPHRFLALRKTNKSAKRSVFQLIDDYNIKFKQRVERNRTELTFTYPNGSQIYCSGLDDPSKVKSIEGITGIWFEEAIEFELDDFLTLDPILRGQNVDYFQIIFTFNPTDPYHWLRDLFFSGDNAYKKQATAIKTTIDDNIYATEEDRRTLDNLKGVDDQLYNIYRFGEWTEFTNLIYSNWDIVDEFPVLDNVCYGMDFNFVEPYAIVECRMKNKDVYLKELYYDTVDDPNMMVEEARKVIPDKRRMIYADSARPELIKLLSAYFPSIVGADKGPGSVLNGIDYVKQFKLHILSSSHNLIREIRSYKRREIRGRIIDEPAKINDHLMDAMRYAIVGHNPQPRLAIEII